MEWVGLVWKSIVLIGILIDLEVLDIISNGCGKVIEKKFIEWIIYSTGNSMNQRISESINENESVNENESMNKWEIINEWEWIN